MLKTKIICTLGPACDETETMRELLRNGMSAARMNFSHGTHEEHLERLTKFKALRDELGLHTALLLDTKGPEIRIGTFGQKRVELLPGQQFTLSTRETPGDSTRVWVSYDALPGDVMAGQSILIDDGLVELRVLETKETEIVCAVVNGGELSDRKSVNIPGAKINLPAITAQDEQDILFAIEHEFDYIAISFVRKASDVLDVRSVLEHNHGNRIKLISKIENREGIDNIDEILRVSDGIMIARGDLGVEIPFEEIPALQKLLIKKTYKSGKPVITATQMLDSMIRNPRPTRAEATDVANAIYDGTSAIMLSGETASGKHPAEALRTMVKIAEATEQSIHYWNRFVSDSFDMPPTVTNAISYACCSSAMNLGARAILTVTKSGKTARMLSRFRPNCPIIAATTDEVTLRQLMLSWGVEPTSVKEVLSTDDLFRVAVDGALREGMVARGDLVVITAGVPVGISGTTNILKIETVGDILISGKGLGSGKASGELFLAHFESWREEDIPDDCLLVAQKLTNGLIKLVRKARGLILEADDDAGQAKTIAEALDIPVIIQANGAMSTLKSGTIATIDAHSGTVSRT